jgi:hypothetical protein
MNYLPYPEAVKTTVGCKVSWSVYADRETAELAAHAAKHNARIDAGQGYDFGFCCPGSIEVTKDGLFEVCLP